MQNSTPVLAPPSNIYIIGCGGVASFLLPCLLKLVTPDARRGLATLTLIDGDTLEERNLDRQLFSPDCLGMNKAEALIKTVIGENDSALVAPSYFTPGTVVEEGSLLFCCADNHAARAAVLDACDQHSGQAIIGGNEYTDADAYYYNFRWRETTLDPRQYFKEILTDHSGDPTRPAGCTGEAQAASPQLALANMSAANHMLWLFWFYFAEVRHMGPESRPYWPVRHSNTFSRMSTQLLKDFKSEPERTP